MNHFEEIDLIAPIKRALADENYVTPTPIQAQTIPAAITGCDVLGCAQTGTGKTAAFALPILNRLGKQNRKPVPNQPAALILAPTRELAIQIGESFATYGKHLRVKTALVYGGVNQNNQIRAMQRGVHVLVATPGRLLDLMNQGHINLSRLDVFVLDEADRMLDMGFLPDLKRIIQELPEDRQSLFFSATMPPKIVDLSQRLLLNPVTVTVKPKKSTAQLIDQQVVFCERGDKQTLLKDLVRADDAERVIVFTRTKRGANTVADKLEKAGISSAAIHGNKSQNARQRTLDAFRKNKIHVLVATDVAARGIDIDGVTHVINYDLPTEPESYVHRIGRTGRAEASGVAISFCTSAERDDLRAIEQLIGKKVPLAPNQPKPTPGGSRDEVRGSGGRPSKPRGGPRSRNRSARPAGKSSGPKMSGNPVAATGGAGTAVAAKPRRSQKRKAGFGVGIMDGEAVATATRAPRPKGSGRKPRPQQG
ncbi:ATP-dependent RNA helicase RhlE [Rubripirellula lacrimiformis]|uniref:DEAD-box ATP-dependent RNA helicase RhpA n=1 Tax=Rubripirellula lacrimiformis TaxID=1930273 RepID=A0A517NI49_9BACT|nr:DEAD/DEAH box helicase [Rubripirellula lacrimiformis]QDT06811.1 ATP-dependent RNA helicase RhlE [Rubripirellula lacrimiformis]